MKIVLENAVSGKDLVELCGDQMQVIFGNLFGEHYGSLQEFFFVLLTHVPPRKPTRSIIPIFSAAKVEFHPKMIDFITSDPFYDQLKEFLADKSSPPHYNKKTISQKKLQGCIFLKHLVFRNLKEVNEMIFKKDILTLCFNNFFESKWGNLFHSTFTEILIRK